MIELYTGTPGSGKSLHCTRTIRDYLKLRKQDVIANFEVVVDERWKGNFTYVPNSRLTPDCIVSIAANYWRSRPFKENGLLVAIDEAQLLFNSRTWQSKDRMAWLTLMSQNRKHGLRIILVCQADIMIDKQFRSLVEYEVMHRKIANLGMFGSVLKKLMLNQEVFVAITRYYGLNMVTGREFFRYKRKIGSMYNSYRAFEQASAADAAETAETRNGVYTSPIPAYGEERDRAIPVINRVYNT